MAGLPSLGKALPYRLLLVTRLLGAVAASRYIVMDQAGSSAVENTLLLWSAMFAVLKPSVEHVMSDWSSKSLRASIGMRA